MSGQRFAVVGVGHMGRFHAQKLAELAREGVLVFAGVCDADPARAEQVAGELGCPVLADLDAVIAAADAACVAVPTVHHRSVAEQLLESGKDVLVEKPLATTRDEARRLIELADSRGRILQVGHVERFSRAFRAILPMIERPRFIEVHRMGPYPGRATDVGVVLDLMIHDLDIVMLLAGSEVESAEAVGVPVLSTTEDIANARVRLANGCVANLTASRVSVEPVRKVRLFQSDAYFSIDLRANKITVMRRKGTPGGDAPPEITVETLELDAGDALLAQDREFATAVRTRERPEVGGADAYRALDLALRLVESMPDPEALA